jgi:hypothetical protein
MITLAVGALGQGYRLGPCHVVSHQKLLIELANRYLRAITGKTVPGEFLLDVLVPLIEG